MKISYLITCSTEVETLKNLVIKLATILDNNEDEIIFLIDEDVKNNEETIKIVDKIKTLEGIFQYGVDRIKSYSHPLNADYGTHKNWGTLQCKGDYIFQIDGDELPSENILGENLRAIIESNPEVELIFVPRINDYRGVTENHARQWGWRLSPSSSVIHEKLIDTESLEYKFLKNNGYILEETKV